jgi:hypothetical protein
MDTKATSVFGIFQDVSSLRRAAMALRDAEYRNTAVSVLFPDKRCTTFAQEKKTNASEGLTGGSRIGAVVGGAFGWLTGSGTFTFPGLESLMASGPIVAAMAGVGVGGVVGGILSTLVDLRIRAHRARRDEERRKSGGFLLSVHCDDTDWARRAEMILKNTGADAVSFSGSVAA